VTAAFGSSGVVVCLVFGLFTRFGGQTSALAALLTGAGVWGAGTLTDLTTTPYSFALCAAVAAYVLLARWGTPKSLAVSDRCVREVPLKHKN